MVLIKKLKFVAPFAILFVLFFMLWNELFSNRAQAYPGTMVGESLPNFSLPSIYSSGNLSNRTLKGRVTVLNFWASWCSACKAEMSTLMRIKRDYKVPMYGIAYKDSPSDAKAALKQRGNPYRMVASDEYGDVGVDFGIYGTPEMFVISPSGKIIYKHLGAITISEWRNNIYPVIKKYS